MIIANICESLPKSYHYANINCNVIDPGATTLNAQIIFDIIKKLPDTSEVEFISNDGKMLTIRSNVSKFSLSCLPKDEGACPQREGQVPCLV